jgi:hypothetical protein
MNNKFARSILLAGFVIGGFGLARAQTEPTGATPQLPPMPGPGVVTTQLVGAGMGFQFVSAEPAVSTRVVKNAPYSLEATIETAQTLYDGNRIVHRQVVRVFRDAEGRTRREETLSAIGPWAASGPPPTIVTIQDPVSGRTYSLDPQIKVATTLPSGLGLQTHDPQIKVATTLPSVLGGQTQGFVLGINGGGLSGMAGGNAINSSSAATTSSVGAAPVVGGFQTAGAGDGFVLVQNGMPVQMLAPEETSESLGKQTIAGVSADGTRISTTIPANAIGNERPLQSTKERWYSPELQIILRSKQTDPRFGEITYEVTQLDRGKPARALFEIPSDYQVRDVRAPSPPPGAAPK